MGIRRFELSIILLRHSLAVRNCEETGQFAGNGQALRIGCRNILTLHQGHSGKRGGRHRAMGHRGCKIGLTGAEALGAYFGKPRPRAVRGAMRCSQSTKRDKLVCVGIRDIVCVGLRDVVVCVVISTVSIALIAALQLAVTISVVHCGSFGWSRSCSNTGIATSLWAFGHCHLKQVLL